MLRLPYPSRTNRFIQIYNSGQEHEDIRDDEVYLDTSSLQKCPSELQFIAAMNKKISRTEMFKNQKFVSGRCLVLLGSRGYCITAPKIVAMENPFLVRV